MSDRQPTEDRNAIEAEMIAQHVDDCPTWVPNFVNWPTATPCIPLRCLELASIVSCRSTWPKPSSAAFISKNASF
jgi:hypothetical protein